MKSADTALQALIEHAAAFSSRDNGRYAQNLSLPFVHLWPDGEVLRYEKPDDVDLLGHYVRAGLDDANFGRTELDQAQLVLDWDGLKAFRVNFTRFSPDGRESSRSEAIWVAIRGPEAWKLKLRIGASAIPARHCHARSLRDGTR